MNSYRERPAPTGLTCLWDRTSDGTGVGRVVPDGCTDLIWSEASGELFVAGPDTVGHPTRMGAGRMFGVRFAPGVGPSVFGVPGHVLRDLRVPLAELRPDVEELLDAVGTAADPCAALADVALAELRESPPDRSLHAVVAAVRARRVPEVADQLGLGERQLRRRCLAAFGYGPKVLQRVLRFDQAMKLAWAGVPFADIAYRTGYADQAHLSREVKDLAGVPLGQLIRP